MKRRTKESNVAEFTRLLIELWTLNPDRAVRFGERMMAVMGGRSER